MTPNRLLMMCLAIITMHGCAMFSMSSAEMILNGKKSNTYCYGESVESIAQKIQDYYEGCEVHLGENIMTPGFNRRGWGNANDYSDLDHLNKSSIVRPTQSKVEVFPKSRRVSVVSDRFFSMVANVTERDSDPVCRTAVDFYAPYAWERKFQNINKFINTNGSTGCDGL